MTIKHKVSVSSPLTVGSLGDFYKELSGLSVDREVTIAFVHDPSLDDDRYTIDGLPFPGGHAELFVEWEGDLT